MLGRTVWLDVHHSTTYDWTPKKVVGDVAVVRDRDRTCIVFTSYHATKLATAAVQGSGW